MENKFKDLIIISDYDCCYDISIFYKDKTLFNKNITGEHNNIYKDYLKCHSKEHFNEMCNKYKCNLLICCDGGIDFYKLNERGNNNESK